MSRLTEREAELRARYRSEFVPYAGVCLKIRPKDPRAGNQPLVLNTAQRYVHTRLEEQLRLTGKIRALVLKGRQQGMSTYIGGRFYWRVTHGRGIRCFILTHEQEATNNLFSMVERYHDHCPALMKPQTGASPAAARQTSGATTGGRDGSGICQAENALKWIGGGMAQVCHEETVGAYLSNVRSAAASGHL